MVIVLVFCITVFFIITILDNKPSYDEKQLMNKIKEKTGFELQNKVKIIKYENSGLAISDFMENYKISIREDDHDQLIKYAKMQGYEHLEHGYQYSDYKNYMDIFNIYISVEENTVEIYTGNE